jgi:ABC-2 type transport system permease protein
VNEISVWRIERWRLVRTRRLLALAAVFVFSGVVEPLTVKYANQLLNGAGNAERIKITIPPPVPADGISAYTGQATLIGLIVSVVVASYACAVDANPALSVFYRTRVRGFAALVLPRVVVTACGVVAAYLLGLLAAWYETTTLIGAPDLAPMVFSALLVSLYLVFAVAVTALAGTVARSRLGTVGISLMILLAFPIAGSLSALSRWLPSALAGAPEALLRHTAPDHFPRSVAGTVVFGVAALALACSRGARREAG